MRHCAQQTEFEDSVFSSRHLAGIFAANFRLADYPGLARVGTHFFSITGEPPNAVTVLFFRIGLTPAHFPDACRLTAPLMAATSPRLK
jgi:hypothetical protein